MSSRFVDVVVTQRLAPLELAVAEEKPQLLRGDVLSALNLGLELFHRHGSLDLELELLAFAPCAVGAWRWGDFLGGYGVSAAGCEWGWRGVLYRGAVRRLMPPHSCMLR